MPFEFDDTGYSLRNEYLAENRILRGQIRGRLLLSEREEATLAEIAHRLGRMALEDVAATAKPDTILGWYRKLVANKFDESKFRRSVGRPKLDEGTEPLVMQMARENPSWGYDRIVGALANLGHRLSDQTVDNVPRCHGISPAEAKAIDLLDGLYPRTPGRFGGDGFLHDGSPNARRVDDLLCAVLHPLGESPSETGRIHAVPGSGVDGAAGAQHDDGGVGKPERLLLSAA
jgi:hypothetical protein